MNRRMMAIGMAAALLGGVTAQAECSCTNCTCAKPAYEKPDSPSCRVSKMPFRLGIAGYTFSAKSLEETLATMKRIDCHYLCIKPKLIDYGKGAEAPIAEYKAKCAEYGVECLAAGPLYYDNEETARKLFEFAKAYGLKTVVVVPYEDNPKWKKGMPWREKRLESDKMVDVLEKLVKEFDIRAAIQIGRAHV